MLNKSIDNPFAWNEAIQKMTSDGQNSVSQKVTHEDMKTLPKIIAVDFDGTLVTDKFPEIGNPIWENVETLRAIKAAGVKIVFYSCRDNDTPERHQDVAVAYCRDELGIEFDAINCNIPEVIAMFHNDTRKVYANVYWDDKAVTHVTHPMYWCNKLGLDYIKDLAELLSGFGACNGSGK